ncbi:MAG: hypothetical protein K2Y01_10240 [Rhabdochlamydiaceae bacterium]|nr:hypothetical protein [Rhabdochlamydiaceae bacterium]
MSISLWVSKSPLERTLYIAIPAIHLLIIAVSLVSHPSLKRSSSKPIVINTWTPPAPASKQIRTTSAPPAAPKKTKAAPAPTPTPAAKPLNKTVTADPQKTAAPKKEKLAINPKPAPKQSAKTPSVAQKHLQEIEERIAKIEAKNDRMPIKSELAVPTTITLSSQIPPQNSLEFANYQTFAMEDAVSSLIGYLQGYLQLPDLGEVQIQLILRKDGKVDSMKVLKTESEKNRKYLEEQLPKLSFPSSILEGVSSRSFLLTFCNK